MVNLTNPNTVTVEIQDKLNDLIQYLQDSRNGYQECAKDIESGVLQALFHELSRKRQAMVDELSRQFGGLKAAENKNGTLLGRAHQYFINLKSTVTGGDVEAIIKEVKRGENTTIEAYREVLREPLPEEGRAILSKQLQEVENNLSEIDLASPSTTNAT